MNTNNVNYFNMGRGDNFNIDTEEGLANAVKWTNHVFSLIVDGGRWIVPRSMSAYEINHGTKTVRRVLGAFPEPIIERVIKAAGWKYEEKTVL